MIRAYTQTVKEAIWNWLCVDDEVNRRVNRNMQTLEWRLRDQLAKESREDKERLNNCLRHLVRFRREEHHNYFTVSYHIDVKDVVLMRDRDDMKYLARYIGDYFAHEIMNIRPVPVPEKQFYRSIAADGSIPTTPSF